MSEIDILYINDKIYKNFEDEKNKVEEYKLKLNEICNTLNNNNLKQSIKMKLQESKNDLENYIKDIENDTSRNFYTLETADLIEKYKDILNKPLKMSFMGKSVSNTKEKEQIISKYLEIAYKYVDINVNYEKKDKNICNNCKGKDFDIEEGNIYICCNCSAQKILLKNISSYKDINRINIGTKYIYSRSIHFKDAINQYSAKQNSTIPQKIYDDLENEFELHHLLEGDKNTPKEERFKRITKEHIQIFLKELDYTKHYENINLIHYNLTGVKPDDISYLEDKLIEDFEILTELYDKMYKHLDRKNFINTQYILYQLLQKHKHPCKKEDFSMLKTVDKLAFHDEVCCKLFTTLNWSFKPY